MKNPQRLAHSSLAFAPCSATPAGLAAHDRRSVIRLHALILGLGALVAPSLHAASDSWDGATDSVWSTATNWLTDTSAPGTGETATFNGAGNGNTTIDLGAGVTVGSVVFDTASAAAYTIGAGGVGAQALSLDNAGSITVNSGVTVAQLFNANLQLNSAAAAATTITNNGTGLLTLAGTVNANVASGNGVLNVTGSGNTTISGAITKTGAGSNALLKTGTGTLTLSNGSAWTGTGAIGYVPVTSAGFPVVVREGTLQLAGGTHTVTGELVIGGVVTNGGAGQNAKLQVDSGTLAISSWLSVGRGNGTGVATSDLELNNAATVTAVNMSAGFNGGSALNMPKGTITLNGSSSLTVSNAVYLGESTGANFTLNLNGTSQFAQTANANDTRVGASAGAVGAINVNGGTATFERDLILGYTGTGAGTLTINSGTVNVANNTERWLIVNRDGTGSGTIEINGGTLNLNTNTDLRMHTQSTAANGTATVTLNSGSITGYVGNKTGGFSVNSVVDLNRSATGAAVSNFHLNGGTLTIGQVMTNNNAGTVAFNFNGGTLRAAGATANFVDLGGAAQRANVRNGGAIIDSNGVAVTIPEALQHSDIGGDNATDGGLTKNGLGTLTLSGASTYTGGTTVNAGTLALSAAGTIASSTYTIANGAELDVSAKAAYALSGVTASIGLDASTGGFFDAGAAALDFTNGNLSLGFSTASLIVGHTYNLLDFGSQTGDLTSVALSGSFSGSLVRSAEVWSGEAGGYAFSFNEGDGVLTIGAAIPEPSTFAALAGVLGLGFAACRRRRS